MPKLRQNMITGDWVVIAPERAKRPEDFVEAKRQPKTQAKDGCPFCPPKGEAYLSKIEGTETTNVYAIPNKFPAFVTEDEIIEEGGDFYNSYKSLGNHEVLSLKDHDAEIPYLKPDVLYDLFDLYRKRITINNKNPIIEYSLVIHNFGAEAGASIDHPHSQLFCSSVIPSYISKEIEGSKKYYKENQECIYCRLIKEEKKGEVRIISENSDFIAFTFFAARFPFEIWILPKNHSSRFESIKSSQIKNLVEIFLDIQIRLKNLLNEPAYNYFIHTAPADPSHTSIYYHWHLEIAPRVSKIGAYELGSGIYIDVVSPESAASFLREEKRG